MKRLPRYVGKLPVLPVGFKYQHLGEGTGDWDRPLRPHGFKGLVWSAGSGWEHADGLLGVYKGQYYAALVPLKIKTPYLASDLTCFIVQSALTYAQGQWSGLDVSKHLLQTAGIRPAEIKVVLKDRPEEQKRLVKLLRKK